MKKGLLLIGVGIVNLTHALLHIVQFIQSMVLVKVYAFGLNQPADDGIIHKIMHSPYAAILWGLIGVYTLVIGIKDFNHHRKCH